MKKGGICITSITLFTARRLLVIKEMYNQAILCRIDGSDTSRMIACHHLDMAVELFLKTILTYLDPLVKIKFIQFPDLWKNTNQICQNKMTYILPYESDMITLHGSRNQVQHQGSVPSSSDLLQFEICVKKFLDEVLLAIFSKKLDDIFFADVIHNIQIKNFLKDAELLLIRNNFNQSVEKVSVAFELGKHYKMKEIKKRHGYAPSLSSHMSPLIPDFNNIGSSFGSFGGTREVEFLGRDLTEIKRGLNDLVRDMSEMRRTISNELELLRSINDILMLGLNYLDYNKFKKMSYNVFNIESHPDSWTSRDKSISNTKDDALFCLNFVFMALQLWRV